MICKLVTRRSWLVTRGLFFTSDESRATSDNQWTFPGLSFDTTRWPISPLRVKISELTIVKIPPNRLVSWNLKERWASFIFFFLSRKRRNFLILLLRVSGQLSLIIKVKTPTTSCPNFVEGPRLTRKTLARPLVERLNKYYLMIIEMSFPLPGPKHLSNKFKLRSLSYFLFVHSKKKLREKTPPLKKCYKNIYSITHWNVFRIVNNYLFSKHYS